MNRPRIAALVLFPLLLWNSGCATVLHGTEQAVSIRSKDPSAQIFVDEKYLGKGEVTAWLPKKGNPKIVVKKAGCQNAELVIPKKVDNWSFLGIAIDLGLVSILVVDWAITGAVHQFAPTQFTLTPQCPGGGA